MATPTFLQPSISITTVDSYGTVHTKKISFKSISFNVDPDFVDLKLHSTVKNNDPDSISMDIIATVKKEFVFLESNVNKNDDIINSRFEILDL